MSNTSLGSRVPSHVHTLLEHLHKLSAEQELAIPMQHFTAVRERFDSEPAAAMKDMDALMLDKFIALEQEKCLFVYNLLLATGATTVVEAGTSFGVSTIYLALAVAENAARTGTTGVVIGTEKEESKAAIARKHWKEAGPEVERCIDLKVGDLHETLAGDLGLDEGRKVDFLLLDIWSYVALPALELVLPKLRPGAVVISDNTISSADGYRDVFKLIRNANGPFTSITLPYKNGLELSIYNP